MDPIINCIIKWLKDGKTQPYALQIIPTNNCNLSCLSCQARGKDDFIPKEENISNEQYMKMVHDASKLGIKHVEILGGGEPLTLKNTTFSIMKAIKQYNMQGFLVTNGTLFNEDMIKNLVEIGFDEIVFSIDGPDKKTNDFLRGRGSFDKSINSLRLFSFWKKKLKKDQPRIVLNPVLSSKNFDKINKFVELAYNLNIDKVTLQPIIIPDNKLGRMLKLSDGQKKEFEYHLEEAIKLADKYQIKTNFKDLRSNNLIKESTKIKNIIQQDSKNEDHKFLSTPCYRPFFFIAINVDGEVYPCSMVSNPSKFGNIKYKSLDSIWYGRHFENFRKNLINKNIGPICQECCGMVVMENRTIREQLRAHLKK